MCVCAIGVTGINNNWKDKQNTKADAGVYGRSALHLSVMKLNTSHKYVIQTALAKQKVVKFQRISVETSQAKIAAMPDADNIQLFH